MPPLFVVWLNTCMSDNIIIVEMLRESGIYSSGTSVTVVWIPRR